MSPKFGIFFRKNKRLGTARFRCGFYNSSRACKFTLRRM